MLISNVPVALIFFPTFQDSNTRGNFPQLGGFENITNKGKRVLNILYRVATLRKSYVYTRC